MRKMTWVCLGILLLPAMFGFSGCQPQPPELTITSVPPYGQFGYVDGRAKNVNYYDYKVALYIKVNSLYYIKPYDNNYDIFLNFDGTWSANMTTGGEDQLATAVDAFLIPADVEPPVCNPCQDLPQIAQAVTQAHYTRHEESVGEGEGENAGEGEGEAQIAIFISHIPALGSWSDTLSGRVSGVDYSAYQVSVYILVGQSWWIKPFEGTPLTDIGSDGSWSLNPASGGVDDTATSYLVFLVPRGAAVPDCVPCSDKPSPAMAIATCEQSRG